MKVLGVLGGRSARPEALRDWAEAADHLYAADSGADGLLQLGLRPTVVGDLDSVAANLSGLRVVEDPDPDRSDCDKLIDLVQQEVKNPDLVIAAFEGDRFDHMLASLSSIFRAVCPTRILLDTGIGYVLNRPQIRELSEREGAVVSLLPLGECIATMTGCQWPFHRKTLQFGGFHSLSNIAGPDFRVEIVEGQAILIVTAPAAPW